MFDRPDDYRIMIWAEAHLACTQDFDRTFRNRSKYFIQEFGYLLTGCYLADLRGSPLTVGAACQIMKSGSARTREARINRAVDDGYLVKERASDDGRAALLKPTDALKRLLMEHFSRTHQIIVEAIDKLESESSSSSVAMRR
jgi:hypothetical protein